MPAAAKSKGPSMPVGQVSVAAATATASASATDFPSPSLQQDEADLHAAFTADKVYSLFFLCGSSLHYI